MNEVNILNIGGIDYNIDDQLARDVIAHSENGLDPQSNLPLSSRHYDEGDYLIGQDRLYYEATSDIEIGDVIAEGVNVRATIISEELVRLKNQSSIAVIQSIAKVESTALSSRNYTVGQYFYWDFGLAAGLYETIATITSGDALSVGVNIELANKIIDMVDGLSDAYNITGAKNLCPNNASDTTTTDITWDVLSDGSIQVSGTPASERVLTICGDGVVLPAGTYTLTTGTNRVCLQAKNKANGTVLGRSNGSSYPATFTISSETTVTFLLYTIGGTSSMNVRAYPMCRIASITDESYVPYAMTNKLLTQGLRDNTIIKTVPVPISHASFNQGSILYTQYGKLLVCKLIAYSPFTLAQDQDYILALNLPYLHEFISSGYGHTLFTNGSFSCNIDANGRFVLHTYTTIPPDWYAMDIIGIM